MDVPTPEPGQVEHRLREDQPVGQDHQRVEMQPAQRGLGVRVLQGLWLQHRQAMRLRQRLDRPRLCFLAAAGAAVRLREHCGDLVARGEQRYGPYTPVGGPIPLHRYRRFKKTKTQR